MKKKQPKIPNDKEYTLVGGPRDGDTMRLIYPPPPVMRLAIPEWATYHYDKNLDTFRFVEEPT